MKKNIYLLLLVLSSLFWNAQTEMTTKYFSFNCRCSEDENYYNPKNQSYNYSYGETDGDSGYLIAVREMLYRDKQQQQDYLSAIKNSNTFNYKESQFKGKYALIGDISQPNAFGKQILLFHNNVAYTMIVVGTSKVTVEKLYKSFQDTFKFK